MSDDRNGQSGLSICEVCANVRGAAIIPVIRAAVTTAVCVSVLIRLTECMVLFFLKGEITVALNQGRSAI